VIAHGSIGIKEAKRIASDPEVQRAMATIRQASVPHGESIRQQAALHAPENSSAGMIARVTLLENQVRTLTLEVELYRPVIIRLGVLLAGKEDW
jgi:hypothetical protein